MSPAGRLIGGPTNNRTVPANTERQDTGTTTNSALFCNTPELAIPLKGTHLEDLNAAPSLAAAKKPGTAATSSRLMFLRQWLRNPLRMSSVTPSGRQLCGMMASAVPAGAPGVIELGAGTGVITRALIRQGIKPEQLLVVEMNEVLHGLLRQTFPRACVVCGDARNLQPLIAQGGSFGDHPVGAVVSSLGLLMMPTEVQHDILAAAFDVLCPGGVFIQYTYGPSRPLAPEVCLKLGLRWRLHGRAWRNLPPARVYIYSRN